MILRHTKGNLSHALTQGQDKQRFMQNVLKAWRHHDYQNFPFFLLNEDDSINTQSKGSILKGQYETNTKSTKIGKR